MAVIEPTIGHPSIDEATEKKREHDMKLSASMMTLGYSNEEISLTFKFRKFIDHRTTSHELHLLSKVSGDNFRCYNVCGYLEDIKEKYDAQFKQLNKNPKRQVLFANTGFSRFEYVRPNIGEIMYDVEKAIMKKAGNLTFSRMDLVQTLAAIKASKENQR